MDEAFNILRWIAGGAALAVGGLISLGNWLTLIGFIVTKGSSSFIPLVGGILAAIGVLILPVPGVWMWAWIPLLADFGTLPMWTWGFATNFFDKNKSTAETASGQENGGNGGQHP